MDEVVFLTITSFPHAILPNKLLQELRALIKGAGLQLPLVDEIAADIFMGEFSAKFVDSAKIAAELLDGTFYCTYFDIDYQEVRRNPKEITRPGKTWFWKSSRSTPNDFANFCASRAGVSLGTWNAATNGMVIEQQQIITTQNLAALYSGLSLQNSLAGRHIELAQRCFTWICGRQQVKVDDWHSQLIVVKNTAYAWRQMVFFLALTDESEVNRFLQWAEIHLNSQPEAFRDRFRPALEGLKLAAQGKKIEDNSSAPGSPRRFLGWSKSKHWLLPETKKR